MTFEEWAKNSKWNFDSSEYAKEIKEIAKAAWEAAQPEWREINEMTDCYKDVLVTCGNHVEVAYRKRCGTWWLAANAIALDGRRPIGWMPIPDTTVEKGNES